MIFPFGSTLRGQGQENPPFHKALCNKKKGAHLGSRCRQSFYWGVHLQLYLRGPPNDLEEYHVGWDLFPSKEIHAVCVGKNEGVLFEWDESRGHEILPTQIILESTLVFQLHAQVRSFGYIFWGPNTSSKGVWMYRGKYIQITIRLHCLIPPILVTWWPPDESRSPQQSLKNVILMVFRKLLSKVRDCKWANPSSMFFESTPRKN